MAKVITHQVNADGKIRYNVMKSDGTTVHHFETFKNGDFQNMIKEYVQNSQDPDLVRYSKYGSASGILIPVSKPISTPIIEKTIHYPEMTHDEYRGGEDAFQMQSERNYNADIEIDALKPSPKGLIYKVQEKRSTKIKTSDEMKLYHTMRTLRYYEGNMSMPSPAPKPSPTKKNSSTKK